MAPLQGREFVAADNAGSLGVVIVNQRFVKRFLPDGEAIDRRIRLPEPGITPPWRTIVGVVPDMFLGGLRPDRGWGVYVPLAQQRWRSVRLVVRCRG